MIIMKPYTTFKMGIDATVITIPSVLGVDKGRVYYFEKLEGSNRITLIPAEEIENQEKE